MKQHFHVEQHQPNAHIYCTDCDKRFKDNRSGGLVLHRSELRYLVLLKNGVCKIIGIFNDC